MIEYLSQLETPPPSSRGLVGRLLRFPLFYKVLIANALLVILGAFVGTAITLRFGGRIEYGEARLALLFTAIGLVLTITLNTLILRAALQPLRSLRGTVGALSLGDFSVRVPQSPLADDDLAYVSSMLNQVLDHVQRYQERVMDLSAGMLRVQEDERQRIARELHDQIGQALTFLLVKLKIIEALPQAGAMQAELRDLRAAVSDTIDQVRRLALDLRPPALDQLGLIPALRELGRTFADQTRVAVALDLPDATLDLPLERATAIYRIVQESLTNVAKHAEARTVWIMLRHDAHTIRLSVSDDGHGFDLEAVRRHERHSDGPGLGLFGMEERVRLLGGACHIESHPGAGTTIAAAIPMNPLETPHGTALIPPVADRDARDAPLAR
jgi:two-component system, NarL family, sensor histidine kinase UhpB